jgi:hypothetical protein
VENLVLKDFNTGAKKKILMLFSSLTAVLKKKNPHLPG